MESNGAPTSVSLTKLAGHAPTMSRNSNPAFVISFLRLLVAYLPFVTCALCGSFLGLLLSCKRLQAARSRAVARTVHVARPACRSTGRGRTRLEMPTVGVSSVRQVTDSDQGAGRLTSGSPSHPHSASSPLSHRDPFLACHLLLHSCHTSPLSIGLHRYDRPQSPHRYASYTPLAPHKPHPRCAPIVGHSTLGAHPIAVR